MAYVRTMPAPPPKLNVKGREVVMMDGCVVEPPAVSGERERFMLELEPGARAQVTLYTKHGETLPQLRYGQRIEADVRVRPPHNYRQSRSVRLRGVAGAAGHLLDRVGRGARTVGCCRGAAACGSSRR